MINRMNIELNWLTNNYATLDYTENYDLTQCLEAFVF